MARRKEGSSGEFISVPFVDAQGEGEIPLAQLDEFIVPGRDDKGGQASITINIPPGLDRQIEVLVHSHRFPYATKRDLVRHAILRHAGWLLGIRQTVPKHFMAFAETSIEICRDDELSMKMEQVFTMLDDRISEHMAVGDHSEVTRLLTMVSQKLRELRPSAWTKRFTERFYKKYKSYLSVNVPEDGIGAAAEEEE